MIRDIIERRLEEAVYVVDRVAIGVERIYLHLSSLLTTKTIIHMAWLIAAVTLLMW